MVLLIVLYLFTSYSVTWPYYKVTAPKGRPGVSDVFPLSGISGLSFDSTLLSPLVILPIPSTLSVVSLYLPAGPFS